MAEDPTGSAQLPTFRLSVSALAEFCCRRGDLNLGLQRSPTAQEGQQGQRQLQQHKPEGYRKEVSVSAHWQTDAFHCHLSGRIDGLLPGPLPQLEEIKTTYCSREQLPDSLRAVHWAQLMLYGALWLQTESTDALQLQLTYLKLDDDTTFNFSETLSRDALLAFHDQCRDDYLQWLRWQCEHWQRRNAHLAGLAFPFTDFRPGQRTLSVQAYRDLRDGQRGLYQAATGLGKSLGILFPALKLLGENRFRQIWYVTAKNSGQRSVRQALAQLGIGAEQPLRVLVLSARENICFCQPGTASPCDAQTGFYDRWAVIRNHLQQQDGWQPDTLLELARQQRLCPHQLNLQLLPWADLVIADYNYVFDPTVRPADYLDSQASHITLLVDEAHNLPDRARDMFSARLSRSALQAAKDSTPDRALRRRINKLLQRFPAAGSTPSVAEAPPDPLVDELATLCERWLDWFNTQQWLVPPDPLFQTLMDLARFSQRLQRWQPEDRWLSHHDDHDAWLDVFCTDPAPQLDALTQRYHAVLYFSGSLQPLTFFARALSQQPFTHTLELPSPFAASRLLTRVVPVNTRYDARSGSLPQLASLIAAVWQAQPGRYLVTFPSYTYLQAVQTQLQRQYPDLPLLSQDALTGTTQTDDFIKALEQAPALALVIAGGRFAEGLDLPANLLQGVIVVGTCMPPPSPQRSLIQQQFQQHGYDGFDFAFRFPGLNRVIQSAGRLIRRNSDKGVLILLDDRFAQPALARHFPAHWQPLRLQSPTQLQEALHAFWAADL